MKILKGKRRQVDTELVIKTYYEDIYRYAFWLTKSKDIAEDVVQDTFEKFITNSSSIKDPERVKSWLITTLRRTFFKNQKKYNKYISLEENEIEYLINDSYLENTTTSNDNVLDLRVAISHLDEKYRDPILLQSIMGLTTKEIAKELNLDENTVLTRIFRAKSKIKESLLVEEKNKYERK